MPRRAIEALETEVRALAERVDRTRQAGADGAALGSLERELAEVRNALRNLTPAESLAGFEEAVRALSHKIDQIAASGQAPQGDPMAFKQLEQAVVSLRGVVSNVASDGALAQLAAEVRGLGAQFERATADSSTEALAKLEARIASLMESGRAVPPELEGSIRALSERLDRMQLSQGDQLALGALEDRIAKLSEKLDASDSRLGHLEAIERGLGRPAGLSRGDAKRRPARPARAAGRARAARRPHRRRPAPAAPHRQRRRRVAQSPLDLIPDLPPHEAAATQMHRAPTADAAAGRSIRAAAAAPMPAAAANRDAAAGAANAARPQRQPIDPNLPPDTPLEPGSGAPRMKPGSAAARIAASEAALGNARPMAHGNRRQVGRHRRRAQRREGGLSRYAREGAEVARPQAAHLAQMAVQEGRQGLFRRAAAPRAGTGALAAADARADAGTDAFDDAAAAADRRQRRAKPLSRGKKILKLAKTLLIAASVAIIVVGVAQTAMEYPVLRTRRGRDAAQGPVQSPPHRAEDPAPSTTPSRPMPAPEGTLPAAAGNRSGADQLDQRQFVVLRSFDRDQAARRHRLDPAEARAAARSRRPAGQSNIDALPASISPALRTAALANDPAAEYELGARYAEGRGMPQSMPEAVRWFERAADAGFAPAQFRLASLNEKGEGMKKDVQAARRLYLAAAGKGHAKAMHNLAVLYAEGIDGKPDYKAASEWFRKAAGYGVTDSQYNLAILYARGIGIPANLAESYRWFALAAANGDTDAAKKRDEVAARLDQQTLAAAKLAVAELRSRARARRGDQPQGAAGRLGPRAGCAGQAAAPDPDVASPRRHRRPASIVR